MPHGTQAPLCLGVIESPFALFAEGLLGARIPKQFWEHECHHKHPFRTTACLVEDQQILTLSPGCYGAQVIQILLSLDWAPALSMPGCFITAPGRGAVHHAHTRLPFASHDYVWVMEHPVLTCGQKVAFGGVPFPSVEASMCEREANSTHKEV